MTTPETMEERFEQKFGVPLPVKVVLSKAELKDFIRQEITLAVQKREEEIREKIENLIDSNDDGMWSGRETAYTILNLLTKDS